MRGETNPPYSRTSGERKRVMFFSTPTGNQALREVADDDERETTIDNTCREECQTATAYDAHCQLYKLKQTHRKLCSVSWTHLDHRHLFSKTSLGALGPNKEGKQVMFQLAVTITSCRGSLCCDTVHGQVALTWSKSVCRTLGTQDSHSQCGRTLVHVLNCLWPTVNATGAPDRSMFPHSSASSPKSSLGSSHQPSVLALASIVFQLPGRKIMSDTPTRASLRRVSKVGFLSKFADSSGT